MEKRGWRKIFRAGESGEPTSCPRLAFVGSHGPYASDREKDYWATDSPAAGVILFLVRVVNADIAEVGRGSRVGRGGRAPTQEGCRTKAWCSCPSTAVGVKVLKVSRAAPVNNCIVEEG